MIQFVPLYDRVMIKALDGDREVEGVILPDTAREEHKAGTVVAVGEGYVSDRGDVRPLRLKVGDSVLFGPYAGIPIQVGGTEFLVMREGEVTGTIRKNESV